MVKRKYQNLICGGNEAGGEGAVSVANVVAADSLGES
jgi:hypothetical protein